MTSNYKKAAVVLKALVQGVDPQTGDPLSTGTILDRSDIIRALLTAVDALESVSAREAHRAALPSSVGKAWSAEEENQLVAEFQKQLIELTHLIETLGGTTGLSEDPDTNTAGGHS